MYFTVPKVIIVPCWYFGILSNTFRYSKILQNTLRYLQIPPDTFGYFQMLLDVSRYYLGTIVLKLGCWNFACSQRRAKSQSQRVWKIIFEAPCKSLRKWCIWKMRRRNWEALLYAKIQCVKSKEEEEGLELQYPAKTTQACPQNYTRVKLSPANRHRTWLACQAEFLLPTIPWAATRTISDSTRECANIFHQLNGDAIPTTLRYCTKSSFRPVVVPPLSSKAKKRTERRELHPVNFLKARPGPMAFQVKSLSENSPFCCWWWLMK